jgi:hypothetical protein
MTADRYRGNSLYPLHVTLFLLLVGVVLLLMNGCATTGTMTITPANLPLLKKWHGDYPLSELDRLPEGQQDSAAGFIGDTGTFIRVWRVFMPKEILPPVDFSKNIVVFTRNVRFYNRTSILKVELLDGTAEIFAMETLSTAPIEDTAAMAMAVIPRDGVLAIRAGTE